MANAIVMPKAGISVESCIIGKWRFKVGDQIEIGDILFDFETDKASFECEATHSGILLTILCETGTEVPCLQPVGVVGERGEDISSFVVSNIKPEVVTVKKSAASSDNSNTSITPVTENAHSVSPRAKQLALRMNIDVSNVAASGPEGRMIERDIIAYSLKNQGGSLIGGRAVDNGSAIGDDYIEEIPSQIRKTIATAMHKSLAEMAQLTHHHSADVTSLLLLRKAYKSAKDEKLNQISINDMIMFSVVKVLPSHEYFNANFVDGVIRKYRSVNLGVAVDTPRGLMVPTIFAAEKLSLEEIAKQAKALAETARSGAISPDLLHGGTFTVSNLGVFGVEMFTPIINPPQTAILGVCNIQDRIKKIGDDLMTYPALGLSLTYDHRVIDGAQAARFMQDLVKYIENFDLA